MLFFAPAPLRTRPHGFGGPESCQRSLDQDFTSSATVFNESRRVALVGSGGWRCHPCYHPCCHPVLFGALESCRWRLDGDYTSSTASMDKATRGAHPPSHPPTHTRPRVFGGPESCQGSLDDDYTRSTAVFDKPIGVALVESRGWRCHPLVGFA